MKFKEILQERLNQIEKDLQTVYESTTYYYNLEIRKQELEEILRIYELENS